jgi:TatD DNase family protein
MLDINKSKFFDTHCHLNLEPLYSNLSSIIKGCDEQRVFVNCVGADFESSLKAIEVTKKYTSRTICSVGIHPEYVNEINKLNELDKYISENIDVIYGIGECGLDYHIVGYDKKTQHELFIKQIELAIKYKLPLIIHCRDAYEDLYTILKQYHNQLTKILIHCFDTGKEWVEKFNEFDCYYAIGGKITYKNAVYLQEAINFIPKTRLIYETDAP